MSKRGTKAELQRAKALIKEKKYSQARKILKQVDHATARKWLAQLDQIAPEQKSSRVTWVLGVGLIALAVGLFVYLGLTSLLDSDMSDFSEPTEEQPQTLELVPVSDANATAIPGATNQLMMYQPPQNWFSQGASFRTCPTLGDDCKTDQVLLTGDPILVLGEVEGETWLNSRLWYYVEFDGEPGFIHSEFITVSSSRPTSTPAPQGGQWASAPGNNNSSSSSSNTTNPTPRPLCDCSGNNYDCRNFGSRSAAQSCYDYCRSQGRGDIHKMDGDSDGRACERMR